MFSWAYVGIARRSGSCCGSWGGSLGDPLETGRPNDIQNVTCFRGRVPVGESHVEVVSWDVFGGSEVPRTAGLAVALGGLVASWGLSGWPGAALGDLGSFLGWPGALLGAACRGPLCNRSYHGTRVASALGLSGPP